MSNTNRIITVEALAAHYGVASEAALAKETASLTPAYRRWIEEAPFLAIATSGPGGLDCSPRGDEKGHLFKILNDRLLAIPDRRGNNRLDTLKNIIANPQVALLFLTPGINETLRINGRASISVDPLHLKSATVAGVAPATVILVDIDAVYFQCARALIRSKLWEPAHFADRKDMPTAGQMIKDAISDFDADTYERELQIRQKSTLY